MALTGQITFNQCDYQVIDVATDSTTIYTGAIMLFGVYVNTVLSAHVLPFLDGATTVITVPASAAAGSMYPFPGILFTTSLIMDPNDSATGNVTVAYRKLNP